MRLLPILVIVFCAVQGWTMKIYTRTTRFPFVTSDKARAFYNGPTYAKQRKLISTLGKRSDIGDGWDELLMMPFKRSSATVNQPVAQNLSKMLRDAVSGVSLTRAELNILVKILAKQLTKEYDRNTNNNQGQTNVNTASDK